MTLRTRRVTHAFCESVHATPDSPVHLRAIGPEGLKPGGGIPTPALCGRDLHGGWDIPDDQVTAARVTALLEHTGPGRLCPSCATAYTTS